MPKVATINKVEIVPSISLHVWELADNLRDKDRLESERLGIHAHHGAFRAFKLAVYRRTALIDDEVAAMWGVYGQVLGVTGQVYFLTTKASEKVSPVTFARIYKSEVRNMSKIFPRLEGYVDDQYPEAKRLLAMSGFDLSEPFMINDNPFRKFILESWDN
jgi:hypothetical protein